MAVIHNVNFYAPGIQSAHMLQNLKPMYSLLDILLIITFFLQCTLSSVNKCIFKDMHLRAVYLAIRCKEAQSPSLTWLLKSGTSKLRLPNSMCNITAAI